MHNLSKNQKGVGLVELLISLIISLGILMTATGAATFFANLNRRGLAAGSAESNLTMTLALAESLTRHAGLGFFSNGAYLCPTLNYSAGDSTLYNGTVFSPLLVSYESLSSDALEVIYASNIVAGAHVTLRADSSVSEASLTSNLNAAIGDAILLTPLVTEPAKPCTVKSVASVTAGGAQEGPVIGFDSSGKHNKVGFSNNSTYQAGSRVSVLGTLVHRRIRLTGSDLMLDQPATNTSVTLLRNVVAFRVLLGVSANTSTSTISSWVPATGTWASLNSGNMPLVKAIKIGILVRNPLPEKPTNGTCSATATAPTLMGISVPLPSDWACYKYQVGEQVVNLQNFNIGLAL